MTRAQVGLAILVVAAIAAGLLGGVTWEAKAQASYGLTIEVIPVAPTVNDNVQITVAGEWPNTCYSIVGHHYTISGSTITVIVDTFVEIDKMCLEMLVPWSVTEDVGCLAEGTYTVNAFVGGASATATFTVVSLPGVTVAVVAPADVSPWSDFAARVTINDVADLSSYQFDVLR